MTRGRAQKAPHAVQCSVATLKFFIFEREVSAFHFVLGPTKSVAGLTRASEAIEQMERGM